MSAQDRFTEVTDPKTILHSGGMRRWKGQCTWIVEYGYFRPPGASHHVEQPNYTVYGVGYRYAPLYEFPKNREPWTVENFRINDDPIMSLDQAFQLAAEYEDRALKEHAGRAHESASQRRKA